ncbi:PD-(D/E)XK nuclease family protein [Sphingobium sp. AR-3-1]|uniref:PD-(D/E)XK nuclease family protein n=1 Tax=Sphingobium psychrophilum TaxID=2728834 RepID=A0A7X9WVV2_9SPHN|nr:PD-(D/E)XK nuclease family protein [Sphingobium psychrophilum]NML10805.1 PD-(D/E)XK nuclease family protein [Sphingobium psychrophilum]
MSEEFVPTLTHATERDIDLLLVEELFASPDFVAWLLVRAGLPVQVGRSTVLHSKRRTRSRREIDIFVEAKTASGEDIALLIENKLDATEQPDQAESYREELDVLAERFSHRAVLIVCPSAYSAQHSDFTGRFDAIVTYEALAEYFAERISHPIPEGARMQFRADLLQQAITKARRGYTPVPNPVIGTFNEKYVALLAQLAPEIMPGPTMLKPANPDESVSMIFDAKRTLAFMPDTIRPSRFAHELGKGSATRANYVAVVFAKWGPALAVVRDALEHDSAGLGVSFSANAATKTRPTPGLVMSWPTHMVNNQGSFEDQEAVIAQGIERALEVCKWLSENQDTLLRWKSLVENELNQ